MWTVTQSIRKKTVLWSDLRDAQNWGAFNKGQISKGLKENLSTINTLKDK